jgi:hypothetical protein
VRPIIGKPALLHPNKQLQKMTDKRSLEGISLACAQAVRALPLHDQAAMLRHSFDGYESCDGPSIISDFADLGGNLIGMLKRTSRPNVPTTIPRVRFRTGAPSFA